MSISVKTALFSNSCKQTSYLPTLPLRTPPRKVCLVSVIFFYGDGTLTYLPTPNLEGLSSRFVSPFSQNLHSTVELTKDLTGIAFRDVKAHHVKAHHCSC